MPHDLSTKSEVSKPKVVGMLHLPPLPGAPLGRLAMGDILTAMLRDAQTLVDGGVNALMLENFGDVPFYPGRVPAATVAQITVVAAEVRRRFTEVPLGINVLRNDGRSALGIAAAIGAAFIRVNILTGARVADQGLIQGIAHDLLRDRAAIGAAAVKIWADIDVKHSAPLAAISIESEVDDTLHRGLAEGLIVSGTGTGKPTDVEHVKRVKSAVEKAGGNAPVYVGSGVTAATIAEFLPFADGFIVGTAFKADGRVANPVDLQRVKELVATARDA